MLEAIYANLDDVPENFRELFTEQNGQFELTGVNGMKTQADIDRLTVSLGKERDLLKQAKAAIGAYGEHTPETIETLLGEVETLRATNGQVDETKLEEALAPRIAAKVGPLQRQLDQANGTISDLTNQVQAFELQNTQRTIDDALKVAFGKHKLTTANAQQDLLLHAQREFNITDGQVMTADGMSPSDWVANQKTERPYLWGVSQGGGAQGANGKHSHGGANPFTHENWNMTEQGKILRESRAKAEQLAKAAGTTIGGIRPNPKK